jgi:TonB family protein
MKKLMLLMAFLAIVAGSGAAQTPAEIKGGILNGKATYLPKPEYPDGAKSAGLEGVVYVKIVIDEAGNVVSAVADDQVRKVYKTGKGDERLEEDEPAADIMLRDAAERAASKAKFSPTLLSGNPVRVTGTIVYNFVAAKDDAVDDGTVSTSATGLRMVTGDVLNGRSISMPKPEYPASARAVRAQGSVNVQVTVDGTGNVVSATAVSGHPLLRASAVSAATEAKFSPVILGGQPVRFTGVLVYNFVAPEREN